MAEGDERNTIQFGFLRFFKVVCEFLRSVFGKKESSIIFEENSKNNFFFSFQ